MTATNQSSLVDDTQSTLGPGRHCARNHASWLLPLAAAGILLAAPLLQTVLERNAQLTVDADMLWLLHILAVALLAARWRMRGALLGLTFSLATFAIVELALESHTGGDLTRDYGGLALIALANVAISLTIGWLSERLSRSDELQRLSLESAQRLAAAEERYRALVEQLPALVYTADLSDVETLYVSPESERLLGYRPEEFIERRSLWRDLVHADDRARVFEPIDWAAHGDRNTLEYRVHHRDGRLLWLSDQYRVARHADGRPAFLQGVVQDITARKAAMERLSSAERRYRSAIEQMPAVSGVSLRDAHATTLYVSPQIESMLGYSVAEFLGDPTLWLRTIHPDDRARVLAQHEQTNATGEPFIAEYRAIAQDGSVVWVWDHAVLAPSDDGGERWQWLKFDVSNRKLAEAAAREHEARFRAAIDGSFDAFYILQSVRDAAGALVDFIYVDVNEQAAALLNLRQSDLLGCSYRGSLPPERFEHYLPLFRQVVETRLPMEEETRSWRPTGDELVIHYQATPFGDGLAVTTRDITERRRSEAARLEAEARYRMLIEQSPATIYTAALDASSTTLYISPQIELLLGYTPAEVVADPRFWSKRLHPDDRAAAEAAVQAGVARGQGGALEYRLIARDGRVVWVRDQAEFVHNTDGLPLYAQGVWVDVTAQKEAEERLRQSEERFRSLVQHGRDIVVILDGAGQISYATPSMTTLLGYDVADLLGTSPLGLIHPDDQAEATTLLGGLLQGIDVDAPAQVRFQHADGAWRYIEAVGVNMLENPSVRGIVVTARDITERKQFEAQLEHQAFYDPLTNLPNRALFLNRLDHALELAARGGAAVGVMFLDLDRFKIINDSLGHAVGDQLLQLLGERIQGCLRAGDTLARLGGDEFIILLEGMRAEGEAVVIAERVIESFRAPYTLAGQEVSLSTSIGIALSQPQHAGQPSAPVLSGDLLRMADIALYRAKATSRATYAVFDPSMNVFSVERLKLESDLRRAIERGELLLHYQPELDLVTGAVVGVEALARWEHPQHGLVPPSEFIPIAEETDLIVSIGQWVLEEGCRQACAWQALSPPGEPLTISVNLSARQFQQPDIVERVAGVVRETGIDPALLRLEITESVVVQDAESTIETLRALRALGVKLAIDDFGTGYSSLSYLTRLTVDTLKVDRSFVSGANSDERSATIVNAVVSLAHSLGMRVTAEGIETAEQLARMRAIGCDRGQGYLFARPLTFHELDTWLAQRATEVRADGAQPRPSDCASRHAVTNADQWVTYAPATHDRI